MSFAGNIRFISTSDWFNLFTSSNDSVETFASKGDCDVNGRCDLSSALDFSDKLGTASLYVESFHFQVHLSTSCLLRLKCGKL